MCRVTRHVLLGLSMVLGCRSAEQVPENGSLLLHVRCAADAPRPDELRASVYDDGGLLWDNARIPAQGPLAASAGTELGTVLIQPGTASGAVRIHVRGLLNGTAVLFGTASSHLVAGHGTNVDIFLDGTVPADSDGDGVPDAIDDCIDSPNPAQQGCVTSVEPGSLLRSDGGPDATTDARIDGWVDDAAREHSDSTTVDSPKDDGDSPSRPDASLERPHDGLSGSDARDSSSDVLAVSDGRDSPSAQADVAMDAAPKSDIAAERPSNLSNGQPCSQASQCASNHCTDGVCCNNACDDRCEECSTGTCTEVRRADDVPECTGSRTCSSRGSCVER